jgi:hypothetical protein
MGAGDKKSVLRVAPKATASSAPIIYGNTVPSLSKAKI